MIPVEGPLQIKELNFDGIAKEVNGYVENLGLSKDLCGWINEEGKLDGLPSNPRATAFFRNLAVGIPGDYIVGPFLLSGPLTYKGTEDEEGQYQDIPQRWVDSLQPDSEWFGSSPKPVSAEHRMRILLSTRLMDLPPLLVKFVRHLMQDERLQGMVAMSRACASYAQCMEGLACTDEHLKAPEEDVAWFKSHGKEAEKP